MSVEDRLPADEHPPTQSLPAETAAFGGVGVTASVSAGRRFGDYELVEELARGGMGVVFKARDLLVVGMILAYPEVAATMTGMAFMQHVLTMVVACVATSAHCLR